MPRLSQNPQQPSVASSLTLPTETEETQVQTTAMFAAVVPDSLPDGQSLLVDTQDPTSPEPRARRGPDHAETPRAAPKRSTSCVSIPDTPGTAPPVVSPLDNTSSFPNRVPRRAADTDSVSAQVCIETHRKLEPSEVKELLQFERAAGWAPTLEMLYWNRELVAGRLHCPEHKVTLRCHVPVSIDQLQVHAPLEWQPFIAAPELEPGPLDFSSPAQDTEVGEPGQPPAAPSASVSPDAKRARQSTDTFANALVEVEASPHQESQLDTPERTR